MTLSISGLTRRYGGLVAVSSVSFEAGPKQITSIIGPNGAGKTTLLNLVSGTVAPNEGSVRLFGTDITDAPPHLRARQGLARTYQTPQLFDDMTVLDTVKVGATESSARALSRCPKGGSCSRISPCSRTWRWARTHSRPPPLRSRSTLC